MQSGEMAARGSTIMARTAEPVSPGQAIPLWMGDRR
jgi:hypothetical protein